MMPIRHMNTLVAVAFLGHVACGHRFWRAGSSSRHAGLLNNQMQHATIAHFNQSILSPMVCGQDVPVHAHSDKSAKCPEECPLYAEMHNDGVPCSFRCVPATVAACSALGGKNTPIPDKERAMCRSCMVPGCDECAEDGTDTCTHCSDGFSLNKKGACDNDSFMFWCIAFSILGAIVVFLVAWIVQLSRRDVINQDGLEMGLETRSLAKLRMPAKIASHGGEESRPSDAHRAVWDILTNLCKTMVGGPGLVLDFNYQAILILWSFGVAAAWAIMAGVVDKDLFVLGTKAGDTSRDMCIVVAWGYETQERLMPAKTAFVFGLYVVTFILTLLHAVRQLRMFQSMDLHATHSDFCALLTALPVMNGDENAEDILKDHIAAQTNTQVVGVSVCWDYLKEDELVMTTVSEDLLALDAQNSSNAFNPKDDDEPGTSARQAKTLIMRASEAAEEEGGIGVVKTQTVDMNNSERIANKGFFDTMFHHVETAFLSPTTQKLITKGRKNKARVPVSRRTAQKRQALADDQEDLSAKIALMSSGGEAFVVFNTETERDHAVLMSAEGIEFRGVKLVLKATDNEPDSITWKNFCNSTTMDKCVKLLFGIGVIFIAITLWTVLFYLPYAWFVSSSNYKYGQEPGALASTTFGMIVVVGNAIMYLVCAEVADRMLLHYHTQRELCYMLLYAFACFFNVLLDMIFSYYIAYWMMVGSDMRTYGGVHVKDLHTFKQRFESYAMQRELGNLLYAYAFPSTFLIPFLIEPWATIYAPYKLMCFIVRSHSEMKGADAESLMESVPMDLSRYADLWLNVTLAVSIFFFPGGLTLGIFFWMAIAHIWIYAFDHFRVLRCIPHCNYSNIIVDWYATWMLSIPLGLLIVCAVFKGNCQTKYLCVEEDDNDGIVLACGMAFLIHEVVFTLALIFLVPLFGKKVHDPSKKEYPEVARKYAASYFNTNPLHCIRSAYFHGHSIPVDFYMPGKEHLMRLNEELGQYFQDERAKIESDFDFKEASAFVKRRGSAIIKAVDQTLHKGDAVEEPMQDSRADSDERAASTV